MQKHEIIKQIVKRTGIKKEDVKELIHATFEVIKDNVEAGHHVFFRGFGTFYPYHVPAKTARHMKPPYKPLHLPPTVKAAFKPSKKGFNIKHTANV